MTINPYPYISGHVRKFLLDHPDVKRELRGGRIGTGPVPDPLKGVYVRVAVSGQVGSTPRVRRLLVQVTPWFPADPAVSGTKEDPSTVVWNLATTLGQVAATARNEVIDEHTAWHAEWIEGPVELFDRERGPDRGLLYTPIVLEVTVSHR
ncbi:hypothetical protein [Corynebacterium sanguinis]|uniref:DUF3168 domain-containing protein n=1 Tax=Corynebacterium sanguinis TaxID=2594913 RepID=A0A6C1TZ43_9CORY|nr:hypothetical protein [Corynebacterium sanguinis]TVS29799.1 hypothetical protein EKI59_02440 [Corynebacterium sanguinis]